MNHCLTGRKEKHFLVLLKGEISKQPLPRIIWRLFELMIKENIHKIRNRKMKNFGA